MPQPPILLQDSTPSVHFNFDESNQKNLSVDQRSYVPYDYSFSNHKLEDTDVNINGPQCQFVTPTCMRNARTRVFVDNEQDDIEMRRQAEIQRIEKAKKLASITVKLNTEEFFDEFDNNFVVNFGESPAKNDNGEFRKNYQSYIDNKNNSVNSKVESYISEPIGRRKASLEKDHDNEQQLVQPNDSRAACSSIVCDKSMGKEESLKENLNQNIFANNQKKQGCQIRKRVLFKTHERWSCKGSRKECRPFSSIINQQNLMIVTSYNWVNSCEPAKKAKQINTQPVKKCDKAIKKVESNIFSTRQMFKQTLRSTTLDNWRKKFIIHKNDLDLKHKTRPHNIFHRPVAILR